MQTLCPVDFFIGLSCEIITNMNANHCVYRRTRSDITQMIINVCFLLLLLKVCRRNYCNDALSRFVRVARISMLHKPRCLSISSNIKTSCCILWTRRCFIVLTGNEMISLVFNCVSQRSVRLFSQRKYVRFTMVHSVIDQSNDSFDCVCKGQSSGCLTEACYKWRRLKSF
jgi:hypothetical protein